MLHSYSLSQNRFSPIQNNTRQFKLISNKNRWELIPCESYIRDFLAPIKASLLKNRGLTLRPYAGTQQQEGDDIEESQMDIVDEYFTYPEHCIANSVEELPIFDNDMVRDMKNGHLHSKNCINRAYTLESNAYQPIACIYFKINLQERCSHLNTVSILDECQGKGLGTILVDIAVIVSALYGCKKMSLSANDLGLMTYLKNGFFVYEAMPWQHYSTFTDADLEAIINNYIGIPMALHFNHLETQEILRAAFLRYLNPDKDILSDLILQNGVYNIIREKLLQILGQQHLLRQSSDLVNGQKCLKMIEDLAKYVRIPESFWAEFFSARDEQSIYQGYSSLPRKAPLALLRP